MKGGEQEEGERRGKGRRGGGGRRGERRREGRGGERENREKKREKKKGEAEAKARRALCRGPDKRTVATYSTYTQQETGQLRHQLIFTSVFLSPLIQVLFSEKANTSLDSDSSNPGASVDQHSCSCLRRSRAGPTPYPRTVPPSTLLP